MKVVRKVPADLIEICKEIVAGLDKNPHYLPQFLIDNFGGDIKKALDYTVDAARKPSKNALQSAKYYGGLVDNGMYVIIDRDNTHKIILSEEDARNIINQGLQKIVAEYF